MTGPTAVRIFAESPGQPRFQSFTQAIAAYVASQTTTCGLALHLGPVKTVILAGGLGTRLSEDTALRPKPMVEIGDRPILWHIMELYASHGLNEFVVACGYKGDVIRQYFSELEATIVHGGNIIVGDHVVNDLSPYHWRRIGYIKLPHPDRNPNSAATDARLRIVECGSRYKCEATAPTYWRAFGITQNDSRVCGCA